MAFNKKYSYVKEKQQQLKLNNRNYDGKHKIHMFENIKRGKTIILQMLMFDEVQSGYIV